MKRFRWAVPASVALALIAGPLSGCSGDDKKAAPKSTVLYPGRPGEPNQTRTVGPPSPTPPNAADVTFVQMMIPHHQQALAMSVLAPKQASDAKVKALADRIDKSQQAEITSMRSWLRRWIKRPGHGGHGTAAHKNMPGMATAAQFKQLQQAGGADFDRLYLDLMIKHHEGALVMARDALAKGRDVTVLELAKDVLSTQQAEINRMRDLVEA